MLKPSKYYVSYGHIRAPLFLLFSALTPISLVTIHKSTYVLAKFVVLERTNLSREFTLNYLGVKMKKIFALLIVTILLMMIPLAAANSTPPLSKIVFVYKKEGFAKPPWAGGGKGKTSEGYELLGKGVKWKELPATYYIDPDNDNGLTVEFVTKAIYDSAEEWDAHTSAELFNDIYTVIDDGTWDSDVPDGRNELLFGDYPEPGVIAVTVVWGYFIGKPSTRKIIEFDILFDTDFTWGDATVESTVMDLQNIATHELGHGVGLADLYDDQWSEQTMYGYATYGETKKRTLESGDIAGIQALYGE